MTSTQNFVTFFGLRVDISQRMARRWLGDGRRETEDERDTQARQINYQPSAPLPSKSFRSFLSNLFLMLSLPIQVFCVVGGSSIRSIFAQAMCGARVAEHRPCIDSMSQWLDVFQSVHRSVRHRSNHRNQHHKEISVIILWWMPCGTASELGKYGKSSLFVRFHFSMRNRWSAWASHSHVAAE